MQTTSETQDTKTKYHLIGLEPKSNIVFNPHFVLTEYDKEKNMEIARSPKAYLNVNSLPEEDYQKLPENTREESIQKLDFILANTDYTFNFNSRSCEGPKNPNPEIVIEPNYVGNTKKEGINYSTTLRILERLAQEGKVWFGSPKTGKTRYDFPKTEPINVEDLEKTLKPEDIQILLGQKGIDPKNNIKFPHLLRVYDQIGLEFKKAKGKEKHSIWIEPTSPFIATLVDSESINYTTEEGTYELLCNLAFIQCIKSDPQKAQRLFEATICDAYHFQAQDAESNYFGIEMFEESAFAAISNLFDYENILKETIQEEIAKLNKRSRMLLAGLIPEIDDTLLNYNQKVKVHLKDYRYKSGKLSLKAVVETPTKVYKIEYKEEKVIWSETKRTRTPKN